MDDLVALIERGLSFRWHGGAVTPVAQPHTTGWRVMPWLVTAQVCDGLTELQVEGGFRERFGDGAAFAVAGGVRHVSTLQTRTAVSRWTHVDIRAFNGAIDALTLIEAPLVLRGPPAARLGDIAADLAAIAAAPLGLAAIARRKALGFELFAIIAEAGRPAPAALERARAVQRLAPALALVERDPATPVPTLARAAGVSPSRLHALFHAALGLSPLAYILRCRLRRAQQLLVGSDLAIGEIAARAGFGDAFHFSRTFRRACGESPRAWRDRRREATL